MKITIGGENYDPEGKITILRKKNDDREREITYLSDSAVNFTAETYEFDIECVCKQGDFRRDVKLWE